MTSNVPLVARRRSVLAVLVVACTLVLLSACAPAAGSGTATLHSIRPHHGGSTPSPTATVASLAPPKVRIPLSCSQIAPTSDLNSALDSTVSPVPTVPYDLGVYEAIQDGALNCSWQGPKTSSSGPVATYTLYAMPDAAALWQKYAANGGLGSISYPTSYLGAPAVGGCFNDVTVTPHSYGCTLDILVGSVWLDVSAYSGTQVTPPTVAQAQAKFQPLFKAAVSALQGATVAEPAWSDPAANTINFTDAFGAVNQAGMAAAIDNTYAVEIDQPDFSLAGAQIAEFLPVNYRETLGGGTGAGDTVTPANDFSLDVEVLPSGSWAYEQIVQAVSGDPGFATLTGFGTKAVVVTAGSNSVYTDGTTIVGVVGENLYSVTAADPGETGNPNTATMARAAAAYVVKELTP